MRSEERKLDRHSGEANKANAAKTEFISQIAHDIRTPMNAVMGFTEIIGQHPEEPEKVVYGLEKFDRRKVFAGTCGRSARYHED